MQIAQRWLDKEAPFDVTTVDGIDSYIKTYNRNLWATRFFYLLFAVLSFNLFYAVIFEPARGTVAQLEELFPGISQALALWLIFSGIEFLKITFGSKPTSVTTFAGFAPFTFLAAGSFIFRLTHGGNSPSLSSIALLLMLVAIITYKTFQASFSGHLQNARTQIINNLIRENKQYAQRVTILQSMVDELSGVTDEK